MTIPAPQKQPPGLFLLFGVEMWERFSYYGMRALLVLFLVSTEGGGFGWSKQDANHLYGWYTSLVYLTPLVGGYLADRFLGTHRSLVIGGILIAAGHFCLAVANQTSFFVGLALVILGTGFFKSNVSTMVGQMYSEGDRRRDAGFTIFYMGVNTGAFIGQIVCGAFADSPRFGWHWGFGGAGVGMVLGLITYLTLKRRYLGTLGEPASKRAAAVSSRDISPLTRQDRDQITAIFLMVFFDIFFWVAFEQAGSSMNFFAAERIDRNWGGFQIPTAWFQSINPLVIMLFAPVFARIWMILGARGREPNTPVKFGIALLLLAAGFVFMVFGARLSEGGAKVSPLWLAAAYLFHTFGELCLSPVGLSMITKLAPARFGSLLMGTWFLGTAAANFIAGRLAGAVEKIERGEVFRLLGGQADFFLVFVISSAAAGVALLLLNGRIHKLMHGKA
jgi:POT family proton-dependent oligopeptide transporter